MHELPASGQLMRSDAAIKELWNKNGEYVEIHVPPRGDPVWRELHVLQELAAGKAVPYREELKAWEGPAASQVYRIEGENGMIVSDRWVLSGGGIQLYLDRAQVALLQRRGFMSARKKTDYADFDPELGNIVPSAGPVFQIVPRSESIPAPARSTAQ